PPQSATLFPYTTLFRSTCSREGDGLTFTYIHEPIEAYDGVEVEVLLQAGDIEVPIRTFGWRLALDDTFVLEGKAELDDRLIDLRSEEHTSELQSREKLV